MPGYLLRTSADNRGELHSGQLHDAWRPMGSIVLLALHSARWPCRPGAAFDATRATPSAHRRVLHRHLDPFRLRNSRTYRTAADGTTF